MKYCFLILSILFFYGCGGGSNNGVASTSANLDGFTTMNMSGSNAVYSAKKDGAGNLVEAGYTSNGKKNGVWMTYNEEGGRIKILTSYTDGQLNGPTLEFDTRGQIVKKTTYKSGIYDGVIANYKFGRVEKSTPYVNGKIEGVYEEYNSKGKLQKQVEFKNGKQDGTLKYFDEEGNVTLEYVYKDGEKVSGGMVKE